MIDKKRLIATTQKVISINSENPPGNELVLSKFIEKDLKSAGLEVKTYTYAKNRPNVVAILKGSLPRKKAKEEAILITPHIDTVPVGSGWKFDPFGSQIVGGKLYGRGATDDKGNLASCMEVMRSLVEDKVKLRKDVIMAATVDEETGSKYGIVSLLEKRVLKAKFALVMDSDEFDTIVVQKGLMHLRVQIFGKKAHGAYNWLGINAVEIAAKVIVAISKLKFKYKKHSVLKPPTINIGVIKGGEKVNMVADFCEFTIDLRFLPFMDHKNILKIIKDTIKKETNRFKILVDDIQFPYEIDKENKYVRAYIDTAKKMGCSARCKGSEGATVISLFKKYNIPAFATGFGAHSTAHATDEYIHVKSLCKGTKVLERFIREYDLI
ncbi:MAG: ArgE/DapE family deacylase [Candidatus Zapsychrus exili]|nr:ArgE/DapE family deacylase [Candidatus Zapsychrus exili]